MSNKKKRRRAILSFAKDLTCSIISESIKDALVPYISEKIDDLIDKIDKKRNKKDG